VGSADTSLVLFCLVTDGLDIRRSSSKSERNGKSLKPRTKKLRKQQRTPIQGLQARALQAKGGKSFPKVARGHP